tara:strand:- start:540 stop:692 length:153 start_codon:yes stop_codon:yes gene_type:complete
MNKECINKSVEIKIMIDEHRSVSKDKNLGSMYESNDASIRKMNGMKLSIY